MSATPVRNGLVLAALLGVADAVSILTTDGDTPPMVVAVLSTVLGLATLAAVVPAWRGSAAGLWTVVGTRLVSALSAVPAFFVGDVPGPIVVLAAGLVGLTLVSVALLVPALRRRPALV